MTIDGVAVDEAQTFTATGTLPTQIYVGTFFSSGGAGTVEVIIDNVEVHQVK